MSLIARTAGKYTDAAGRRMNQSASQSVNKTYSVKSCILLCNLYFEKLVSVRSGEVWLLRINIDIFKYIFFQAFNPQCPIHWTPEDKRTNQRTKQKQREKKVYIKRKQVLTLKC